MQESKVYFWGKHKLYGFKVEVSIRSKGIDYGFSKLYIASVSDSKISTKDFTFTSADLRSVMKIMSPQTILR